MSSSSSDPGPEPRKSTTPQNKKLRVLILSLGGPRQAVLQALFASTPLLLESFEPPVFLSGIPSRSLRNRESFFRHCHQAGLLPEGEWAALQKGFRRAEYRQHSERFFECLEGVPVTTEGRRGSEYDVSVHYSVELWRKAKTVNRGRAVLACALAHLTALRRLVTDDYDVLLEDNVRFPVETVAERMRETVRAVNEWENQSGKQCHLRFFGWLGSTTNLQWIDSSHVPRTKFDRENGKKTSSISCFPMPTLQDIEADLATYNSNDDGNDDDYHHGEARAYELEAGDDEDDERQCESNSNRTTTKKAATKTESSHTKPGGNPVWGTYAYWISKDAFEAVMNTLRKDVGALLWKSKRMRCYLVKPIDKILPRQIRAQFGTASIQLATHPTFFRAPMLTSKIHSQWDPEFCKSTTLQLQQTGLEWSALALTPQEHEVVAHYEATREWRTPAQLQETNPDG